MKMRIGFLTAMQTRCRDVRSSWRLRAPELTRTGATVDGNDCEVYPQDYDFVVVVGELRLTTACQTRDKDV
jgi:hypothetical protein